MTTTLKNSFYTGLMEWNGQKKIGQHDTMISLTEHQRILQIMDSHNLHACRRRKHSFLLRGFVICNICHQRYTGEKHPKKNKEYYHCSAVKKKHSNKGQNIEVENLEILIDDQFKKIQFSQKFINLIMEKLKKLYYQQRETIDSEKQILNNQKKAIEAKRDKAEEKLLNGVLADEDFMRLKTKFKEELEQKQGRIDELNQQKNFDINIVQEIIKLSRNIYEAYKIAPYELKRQYLGLFWDKFLVQDKKIVEAVPTKLIKTLHRKKRVIISSDLLPTSADIITLLKDYNYIAILKEKLNAIKKYKRSINHSDNGFRLA